MPNKPPTIAATTVADPVLPRVQARPRGETRHGSTSRPQRAFDAVACELRRQLDGHPAKLHSRVGHRLLLEELSRELVEWFEHVAGDVEDDSVGSPCVGSRLVLDWDEPRGESGPAERVETHLVRAAVTCRNASPSSSRERRLLPAFACA